MQLIKKILLVIVILLSGATGYYFFDHSDREHRAAPDALAALQSDASVTFTSGDYLVFEPTNISPTTGLIFYPGGEVDERGYAEPLRAIAAAGYLVVLVPMPLQLAVLGIDKADDVIQKFPEIDSWVIAGHSLGGSMAARYAYENTDKLAGLMLWDAYAPDDMSSSGLPIRMIHRSDESGQTPEMYDPYLSLLPADTEYAPLAGGAHLNFGNFIPGRMYRDEPASELPGAQQRELVAQYAIGFMQEVSAAQ